MTNTLQKLDYVLYIKHASVACLFCFIAQLILWFPTKCSTVILVHSITTWACYGCNYMFPDRGACSQHIQHTLKETEGLPRDSGNLLKFTYLTLHVTCISPGSPLETDKSRQQSASRFSCLSPNWAYLCSAVREGLSPLCLDSVRFTYNYLTDRRRHQLAPPSSRSIRAGIKTSRQETSPSLFLLLQGLKLHRAFIIHRRGKNICFTGAWKRTFSWVCSVMRKQKSKDWTGTEWQNPTHLRDSTLNY